MSDVRAKVKDTIYLVWADRGSYSDRTEYAVCWFARKPDAEECAARMREASEKWRSYVANSDEPYGESWDKARKAIGDDHWSPGDETTYSAYELQRGTIRALAEGEGK